MFAAFIDSILQFYRKNFLLNTIKTKEVEI